MACKVVVLPEPVGPTTSNTVNGPAVDQHRGTHGRANHLVALQQVLNICTDQLGCDGAAVLQHKQPEGCCGDILKPQLVHPVDEVLLQLSKPVLNHLVQVGAVSRVGQECAGIAQHVVGVAGPGPRVGGWHLAHPVNGCTVHTDEVPEAPREDGLRLQAGQERAQQVRVLLSGCCLGCCLALAPLGLQEA